MKLRGPDLAQAYEWYFRERALAASLKRSEAPAAGTRAIHFRERALAASLKRTGIASAAFALAIFPRARARGLIEATFVYDDTLG